MTGPTLHDPASGWILGYVYYIAATWFMDQDVSLTHVVRGMTMLVRSIAYALIYVAVCLLT